MAAAVREVAVKHGQDPRDFPLVVAGGAGPNHACMIALELENPVLIVPRESSIFCAAGMLMSDLKHNFVRTYATPLTHADPALFKSFFEEMAKEGKDLLVSEGIAESEIEYHYSLDLRYVKQYHEVEVEISADQVASGDFAGMAKSFHPAHHALYGYSLEEEGTPVELINMRLVCVGKTEKPDFKPQEYAGEDPARAAKGKRNVFLPLQAEFREIAVYDGLELRFGNRIEGPAIVEQVNTTTFVTPEFNVLTDRYGSFTMYLKDREDDVKRRIVT
jgi:N-methylhydantoinase A